MIAMNEVLIDCAPSGRKSKPLPPRKYLEECFSYNPDTGELRWRERPLSHFTNYRGFRIWNARYANTEAGNKFVRPNGSQRYREVGLSMGAQKGNVLYSVARIIFSLMGEELEDGMEVDHRDRDKWNNRWENLRPATRAQNVRNKDSYTRKKKSGLPLGVFKDKTRFIANVGRVRIGSFGSPEEAREAYVNAAKRIHGEFYREPQPDSNPAGVTM